MRFGVNIPNFGPTTGPDELLAWVRFAEDACFDTAVVSDHVAPTPDVAEVYPAPFYDPFVTLAWLAAQTSTVRLGTSVSVLPLRHPLHTARLASNLDRLSAGRFVLGVGVGWSRMEYDAVGVPFEHRGAITDEYLDAIIEAWLHPEVTHDGPAAGYQAVSTGPAPLQRPHPPVWVGGMSPGAIRRAARWATAWHPINPDRDWLVQHGMPALHQAAREIDRRTPDVVPRIKAWVTPDDVTTARRPLGRGSIRQIGADLALLAELDCPEVILDTNPDHPRDRRPAELDWEQLTSIVACAPAA